jgi:hypothetical protein
MTNDPVLDLEGAERPYGLRDCRKCKHCYKESEGWEMPDVFWWSCSVLPRYANLTSFPFKNTKCSEYEEAKK